MVADVMNMNVSNAIKHRELIKIGLDAIEASILLNSKAWQGTGFSFNALTFGVEIEAYNFTRANLIEKCVHKGLSIISSGYTHEDSQHYYKIVSDSSLEGVNSNEVVSPILKGDDGLNSLKSLCDSLNEIDARVNRSCGLHVHIGAANMSDEHYCRLVRNYQKLEPVIDSFMPLSRRANNSRWCRSLQGIDFSNCTTKRQIAAAMSYDRYFKVNAMSYDRHQTVEFRQHSGSIDYTKISNWILFIAKLVEYSAKHEITACNSIDEIPFLSDEQKAYFNNRRTALN